MQRFGHFVNFFFTPLTLHCDQLRAPFCGEANYSKATRSLQGPIAQSGQKIDNRRQQGRWPGGLPRLEPSPNAAYAICRLVRQSASERHRHCLRARRQATRPRIGERRHGCGRNVDVKKPHQITGGVF